MNNTLQRTVAYCLLLHFANQVPNIDLIKVDPCAKNQGQRLNGLVTRVHTRQTQTVSWMLPSASSP